MIDLESLIYIFLLVINYASIHLLCFHVAIMVLKIFHINDYIYHDQLLNVTHEIVIDNGSVHITILYITPVETYISIIHN